MPGKNCNSAPKWILLGTVIIIIALLIAYLIWFEITNAKTPFDVERLNLHSKMFLRTVIVVSSFTIGYIISYKFSDLILSKRAVV